jgi:hypothetical protein
MRYLTLRQSWRLNAAQIHGAAHGAAFSLSFLKEGAAAVYGSL